MLAQHFSHSLDGSPHSLFSFQCISVSNTNVPDKSDVDLDELMKTYAHSLQREMTVTDTVSLKSICLK